MTHPLTDKMTESADAATKSGQIWTSGFQEMSETFGENAKAQIDDTLAHLSALKDAKTFNEAAKLQANFARSYFDKAIADMSKMIKVFNSLAERAFEPIKSQSMSFAEKEAKPAE